MSTDIKRGQKKWDVRGFGEGWGMHMSISALEIQMIMYLETRAGLKRQLTPQTVGDQH